MGELNGKTAKSSSHCGEIHGVSLDFSHGYLGINQFIFFFGIHAHDLTPTGIKITHNVPDMILINPDDHIHVRFKQNKPSLCRTFFKGLGTGNFKSHFRGINGMIGTIHQNNL